MNLYIIPIIIIQILLLIFMSKKYILKQANENIILISLLSFFIGMLVVLCYYNVYVKINLAII